MLKTTKTSTQNNECTPSTSRTYDETFFVETIKNVIKEVNSENESISDKVIKEELQNHEKNITDLQYKKNKFKLQANNKRLGKISADMGELKKSLE